MIQHLSYSSISSYLLCGRSWFFHYVQKVPVPTSPELILGSAFHDAIERYLSERPKTEGNAPDLFMSEIWDTSWKRKTEGQQIAWGAEAPEEFYNQGLRMVSSKVVKEALAVIHPAIDAQGPCIERKVELHVPGVPIPVIGYIDVTTVDGVPGDFKTSARAWTADKAQSELQSLFYLAALNQAGLPTPGWKFRHYVFVKTKTPQVQVFEHCHKPSELFWLFGMILSVWKGIAAEVYPANPTGWKCDAKWCDFWAQCRGR